MFWFHNDILDEVIAQQLSPNIDQYRSTKMCMLVFWDFQSVHDMDHAPNF